MPKTVTTDETPKTNTLLTKWEAFEKAGLKPLSLECAAYRPYFAVDMSCHTKLPIKAENILAHIKAEHSGGFQIKLAKTDGKPHPFWKELRDLGLEAADVRCEVCEKELPLNPQVLLKHMFQAHNIKRGRVTNLINITFTENRPLPKDDDYSFDSDETE